MDHLANPARLEDAQQRALLSHVIKDEGAGQGLAGRANVGGDHRRAAGEQQSHNRLAHQTRGAGDQDHGLGSDGFGAKWARQ